MFAAQRSTTLASFFSQIVFRGEPKYEEKKRAHSRVHNSAHTWRDAEQSAIMLCVQQQYTKSSDQGQRGRVLLLRAQRALEYITHSNITYMAFAQTFTRAFMPHREQ